MRDENRLPDPATLPPNPQPSSGAHMKCGFCGYEFPEEEGIRGCGRCGKPARCMMVRCPRCFYENPQDVPLVGKMRKLMAKKRKTTVSSE